MNLEQLQSIIQRNMSAEEKRSLEEARAAVQEEIKRVIKQTLPIYFGSLGVRPGERYAAEGLLEEVSTALTDLFQKMLRMSKD